MKARQKARAPTHGLVIAEGAVNRNRPLDRAQSVIEPADGVCRAGELLEHISLLGHAQPIDEVRGATIEEVRLTVGLQGRSPAGSDERVLADDASCTRPLGVVDDLGRIRLRVDQDVQDLGMQAPSLCDRNARPDRMPRQLVPEADVGRADLEQLSALRFHRGIDPSRHQRVQQGRTHATRNDRDELDQPARGFVQP